MKPRMPGPVGKKNVLLVNEIFYSIQGEGPFMGHPAVFLRLSGCVKPYCVFCDTPESFENGREMEVEAVFFEIVAHQCPLVVITGGEPFLQWAAGLSELERLLIDSGLEVQYETSGRAGLPANVEGKIILSPKPGQWPEPETLFRAFYLKVLWAEEDSPEILLEIAASGFPSERVWLMALGASRMEQLSQMPLLWEICRASGYRFSPRLHILAFDTQKGI